LDDSKSYHNILYFAKSGKHNTIPLLYKVADYLKNENNIFNYIVVSSTTGYTAFEALKVLKGFNIEIIVCKQDLNEEFSMCESAVKNLSEMCRVVEIPRKYLANKIGESGVKIFRCFSQGIKVCIELLLYLLDMKIMCKGERVILIGGTLRGADTAISVEMVSQNNFKVLNIIAFPQR